MQLKTQTLGHFFFIFWFTRIFQKNVHWQVEKKFLTANELKQASAKFQD